MTKKQDKENISFFAQSVILADFPDMSIDIAIQFISKALDTRIIIDSTYDNLNYWYINNFKSRVFTIDEDDYTEATIQSLKIQHQIAGTDFGTSRQRDFGQKWSDTIRGYLGEIGVKKFLKKSFNLDINLGHELGELEKYLKTDIHEVKFNKDKTFRKSKIKVSIKSIKSNGIWFDIPGAQFNHSDIYILSSLGISVDHLFSYFKNLKIFEEVILKKGIQKKIISENHADEILNLIPNFKKIYGYIPGFIKKEVTNVEGFIYEGKKGRTNYKIHHWSGLYKQEFLKSIARDESVKKVDFLGIGQFSSSNKHVFGLKSLSFKDIEWRQDLIDQV